MPDKLIASTLAAAVLFAVALSGCGGSGGNVRDVMDGPAPPIDNRSLPGGIPAAARNRTHAGGSVVQSSNNTNGVTTDDISVQANFRQGEYVDYRVANGDDWFLDLDDPETRTFANRTGQLPATGSTVIGVLAAKGTSRRTDDAATEIDEGISLVMYTDIEGTTDADYLVWGTWVEVPENASVHGEVVHGVFSYGPDSFMQGDLLSLTGNARYQGNASGLYVEPIEQPLGGYSFEARVTLEADFGDGTSLGTISGSIDNFRLQTDVNGTRQSRPGTMVTLERTLIGGANSGFFEGTTTGNFHDGTPLFGRWGGRFYGNAESDGKPGSVAGTFGSANDDRGLIGAFGAHSGP